MIIVNFFVENYVENYFACGKLYYFSKVYKYKFVKLNFGTLIELIKI
jgi:hypothetical protein